MKVGDRIRYLKCLRRCDEDYNSHNFVIGDIYTVAKDANKYGSFYVVGKRGLALLHRGEFELVSEEVLDVEDLL